MVDFAKKLAESRAKQRRVLICGSRRWNNQDLIFRCLRKANTTRPIDVVIQGEAIGADRMARECAERLGINVLSFPAEWERYGRSAGPVRNQQMLEQGEPTEVWCFSEDLMNSKGTGDMFHRALKAGLLTFTFRSDGFNRYNITPPIRG